VTTYFSECVLIFTSNKGVVQRTDEEQKAEVATPGMAYHDVERIILANIRDFFVKEIGRPELLNRLGGNIVIFDFIGPEIATGIFDSQVTNIATVLREEHGVRLLLSGEARGALCALCTADPLQGGRGIGMALETHLLNPVARRLFDVEPLAGTTITVAGVRQGDDGTPELDLLVTAGPVR